MITEEQIKTEIKNRMKRIVFDVDEKLKSEIKDWDKISRVFQFIGRIKDQHLMSDKELYDNIRQNQFAVAVEQITGSLDLSKKAAKICNSAKEKLGQEDITGILQNEGIKKILTETRMEIAELLRKNIRKHEKMRTKLIEKLQKKEMDRIDEALGKAEKIVIEAEKLEQELYPIMVELSQIISFDITLKENMKKRTESEEFGLEHVEYMNNGIAKMAENRKTIQDLNYKRSVYENNLSILKRQVESIIEEEFAVKSIAFKAESKEPIGELAFQGAE